jgi:hypothetical protein
MAYDEEALLNQCHPAFRFKLASILRQLRAAHWQPMIWELMRTQEQQAGKVKHGYSKTLKSWHVPSTEGHLPANHSSFYVVHGNAADIVDQRYHYQGPAKDLNFQFWKDLGRIAKREGCIWGGDWVSFKDVAHIEILFIESPPAMKAFA